MEAHQQASTNGHPPAGAEDVGELIALRATCRRQARVIDTLTGAVTSLRTIRLAGDTQAPVAARAVLVRALRDRVSAAILGDAQLVTSELVTNSVLHGGASSAMALVFRVQLSDTVVRLEVEDPGRGSTVAPRVPDLSGGGGFGLNVVDALSESWGVDHAPRGTRVWAELALEPT